MDKENSAASQASIAYTEAWWTKRVHENGDCYHRLSHG
jgi:hypothetical protein